ncbi:MAG TPA: hypothetical protein VHO68_01295 [Bacteroidales bacterium]|nr:hypothetical protein [Bacteroidales bacterium]
MKKIRIFLAVVFLLTAGSYTGRVFAQEDTKAKQEREAELQKAINEQKKAIEEQHKAQRDAARELQDNMKELQKLQDLGVDVDVDESGNQVRIYRRGNGGRAFSMDNFTVPDVPTPPDAPMWFGSHFYGGDSEHTTWEFSKSLKENSFKKEYSFDVEKTAKSVVMSVNGNCKSGEIRIKILTPSGKSYSDTVIDEDGNINVRKSFNISENENMDKTGEWKFQISSDKATGYFRISLQTF